MEQLTNNLEQVLKDIAIYLRKSRANGQEETDETLKKHKQILIDFCKKYNLRYVTYEEVVSGDRIQDRPAMQKLLLDIENDLYDGVLVVDIDRLGRGDEEDSGKIKRILRNAGTFIITPQKIYNLENEVDETYLEFQTFLARQEYKMIKKRLLRGKKQGSRMGYWTNGIPPIPYDYNADIKGLIINKEKLFIYNMIKNMYLNDLLTPQQIAWKLNEMKILSPKGKAWHGMVVQRILVDETHLGRIISNKTKGNSRKGEKVKIIPREQWIIKENCHEAVKTIEEHEKILNILKSRKPSSHRNIRPKCILSSIIRCGYCGSVLQIHYSKIYNYNTLNCPGYNHVGKKCDSKGIRENILVDIIWKYIEQYIDINYEFKNNNNTDLDNLKILLIKHEKDKEKVQNKMKFIYQMFEDGDYTKEEFNNRRDERQREIEKIDLLIEEIKKKINSFDIDNIIKNIETCKQLKQNWSDSLTSDQKNKLLSLAFDRIEFFRSKENTDKIRVKLWFN